MPKFYNSTCSAAASHSVSHGKRRHTDETPRSGSYNAAVSEAIRQLRTTFADSADPKWPSAAMIGLCAQIPAAEGRLLERLLRERVSSENSLKLMESGIALPILDDAERMLALNEWTALSSLSVDPDQRATRHYRPDLIVIEKDSGRAILIDVKRSLHSYSGNRQLNALKDKMLAAALVAPQILYLEHRRTVVTRTDVAIIDLGESRRNYGEGIYSLAHLDALLGMEGLASDLDECRRSYRVAVDVLMQSLARESFADSCQTSHKAIDLPPVDTDDGDCCDEWNDAARRSKDRRSSIPTSRIRVAPVGIATLGAATG